MGVIHGLLQSKSGVYLNECPECGCQNSKAKNCPKCEPDKETKKVPFMVKRELTWAEAIANSESASKDFMAALGSDPRFAEIIKDSGGLATLCKQYA